MRKGQAIGQGKGYKNIQGRDPAVHSESAKGIKQPQNVNVFTPKFFNETASLFNRRTKANDNLYSEDDMQFIGKLRSQGISREEAEQKLYEKNNKRLYRLLTINGNEVWQLPKSQYMIEYLPDEKGDNRWRVMEVYVTKDGEVRTRGDLPYIDHKSYTDALEHIEYNAKIDNQIQEDKKLKTFQIWTDSRQGKDALIIKAKDNAEIHKRYPDVNQIIEQSDETLKIIKQKHKDEDSFDKEFGLKPLNKSKTTFDWNKLSPNEKEKIIKTNKLYTNEDLERYIDKKGRL